MAFAAFVAFLAIVAVVDTSQDPDGGAQRHQDVVQRGAWVRPVVGATSQACVTGGVTIGRGARGVEAPSRRRRRSRRTRFALSRRKRGAVTRVPRCQDVTFPAPPGISPSRTPRPRLAQQAGRRLDAAGGRCQPRAAGTTPARLDGGMAASRSIPDVRTTPTAPRESALSTALHAGPAGQAEGRLDAAGGRRSSQTVGTTSAHPIVAGRRPGRSLAPGRRPPPPQEAAPSTAPRAGPVGRAEGQSDSAGGRR